VVRRGRTPPSIETSGDGAHVPLELTVLPSKTPRMLETALHGPRTPVVARIACCCDAFSAMTTDRPYRAALGLEAALEELRATAGAQFDPAVVAALERVLARG
jgi:hypothetical protein